MSGVDKELVSKFSIEIKPLVQQDIEKFDSIFRQHLRDQTTGEILEDEIAEIKDYMMGNKDDYGRLRKYFVAKFNDRVLGCMAYTTMDPDMVQHFPDLKPEDSIELVNAFVDSEVFRGGGVGRKLFDSLCDRARAENKKYLTVNSGPRYQDSWGFYDHLCDENRGFIVDKFGKGRDANTWLKKL